MGGHGTESGEPGRWIGPYRVVALLGEGGMGAVYLGRDARGRVAAVKVLRPETARDEVMVRRFGREADAASAVRGPGVAPVLGYDLDGPVPWIAAAYLAGPTLHEAVAAHGVFGEAGARALTGELARAVGVIHDAGLVHRDLKPSNIVLTREGARIIDFGIARPEYGLTLTQPGVAPATPGYAPPEQVSGRRAGPAADVFALGAVLVFACTGQGPFGSGHPAAVGYRVVHEEPVVEGVPEGLAGVARACLAKEAGDRPTPGELAGWVERAGTSRAPGPAASAPAWPAAPAPTWLTAPLAADIDDRHAEATDLLRTAVPGPSPTRRRLLTAAAGLAVPGIGTGVWWLTRDRSEPQDRTENGVPVATPLASPTADVVPAALWRAEGLHPTGPAPVTAGTVVAAGTPDGVAGWAQDTGRRAWSWKGSEPPVREAGLLSAGATLLVVTTDGRLTALDSRTGRARWQTSDVGAAQALAVTDGTVYVLDRERRVRAVRLTDRRIAWTTAAPLTGTGTARAAATRARLMVSTDDGVAHVLDTRDGKPAWRWDVGKPLVRNGGRHSAPAPAVHDGAFCVPGRPLALVDAHTRKVRWTVDPGLGFYGAPTVAGGRVYAGSGGELWSVDAGTGATGWTVNMLYSGLPLRADVVVGNALYGVMGDPTYSSDGSGSDAGVFTLDIRTGSLLWTFDDQAEQPGWHLAAAAGRAFVARRTTLTAMPPL